MIARTMGQIWITICGGVRASSSPSGGQGVLLASHQCSDLLPQSTVDQGPYALRAPLGRHCRLGQLYMSNCTCGCEPYAEPYQCIPHCSGNAEQASHILHSKPRPIPARALRWFYCIPWDSDVSHTTEAW